MAKEQEQERLLDDKNGMQAYGSLEGDENVAEITGVFWDIPLDVEQEIKGGGNIFQCDNCIVLTMNGAEYNNRLLNHPELANYISSRFGIDVLVKLTTSLLWYQMLFLNLARAD